MSQFFKPCIFRLCNRFATATEVGGNTSPDKFKLSDTSHHVHTALSCFPIPHYNQRTRLSGVGVPSSRRANHCVLGLISGLLRIRFSFPNLIIDTLRRGTPNIRARKKDSTLLSSSPIFLLSFCNFMPIFAKHLFNK